MCGRVFTGGSDAPLVWRESLGPWGGESYSARLCVGSRGSWLDCWGSQHAGWGTVGELGKEQEGWSVRKE